MVPMLDTNCLLRWFLNDVPEQTRRVQALLDGGLSLIVDDVVIIEAIFAMQTNGKLDRTVIADFLQVAMAFPIAMDRKLWSDVLDTWVKCPKLSVVDVYLSAKAHASGQIPVYTFDQKMINQLDNATAVPELIQ